MDWENMQVTIRRGKGNKDRHTVLARALRVDYLLYTKQYEPGQFLFFGRNKNTPITPSLLRWAMDKAIERAGITKNVHLHSLRHSFASHLLSVNTDIVTLQKLLGHDDIRTTMAYLHLNHRPHNEPRSWWQYSIHGVKIFRGIPTFIVWYRQVVLQCKNRGGLLRKRVNSLSMSKSSARCFAESSPMD